MNKAAKNALGVLLVGGAAFACIGAAAVAFSSPKPADPPAAYDPAAPALDTAAPVPADCRPFRIWAHVDGSEFRVYCTDDALVAVSPASHMSDLEILSASVDGVECLGDCIAHGTSADGDCWTAYRFDSAPLAGRSPRNLDMQVSYLHDGEGLCVLGWDGGGDWPCSWGDDAR